MVINPKVSIIVVNYKVKKDLFKCLDSIYGSNPKTKFEIIVVDNDEIKTIEKPLLTKFPKVVYIKSPKNLGFGGGNNLGAKYARGEYLLFLNPDTLIFDGTIDRLCNYLEKNKKTGIVAPLLIDKEGRPFKRQGSRRLDIFNGVFTLSFLGKVFPKASKNFYLENWDKKTNKEVDVAPGTCFMISRELFNKLNGFDESFFLYFEENDICNRVKRLGYNIYILSDSKIYHEIGASTKKVSDLTKIFNKSRYMYFRKYYGFTASLLLESFLRFNRYFLYVVLLLFFAFFLRIYNLPQSMPFIGDQGWFYLSARDMLLNGRIPLVGITSSHTWLHQGPLWTYMLAVMLFIFNFNPISGAFLTALFGSTTALLMYKFGTRMFSKKTGVIAGLLYSCSSLVVLFDRMPYHPSPIPIFAVLYIYSIYKWVNRNIKYFPFILFLIAILYNLELATFILFFPLLILFVYGFIKNRPWVKNLFNGKFFLFSLFSFIVPMLPVIVYDFSNKFHQTVVFFLWVFYKPFNVLLSHSPQGINPTEMINYFFLALQKLIFGPSSIVAIFLFIPSVFVLFYLVFKQKIQVGDSKFILLFLLIISTTGILSSGTPSDAYLPMIFPPMIFTISIFIEFLINRRYTKYLGFLIIVIIITGSLYSDKKIIFGHDFDYRIQAVNKIINLTKGCQYNLVGKGVNSQFESFTMNYQYLLWWKGYPPSKTNQKTKIIIEEKNGQILVSKNSNQ